MRQFLCGFLGMGLWLSRSLLGSDDGSQIRSKALAEAEALFILFGGAQLGPEAYTGLVKELGRTHPGLMVVVPQFAFNVANPWQGREYLKQWQSDLKAAGRENMPFFVGGHSHGGLIAIALAKDFKAQGLILLGSYFPQSPLFGEDFAAYPLPVLSLGGSLDGLTGINYMARAYDLALKAFKPADLIDLRPVVILDGLNHSSFSDGRRQKGDIEPTFGLEEGHKAIARLVDSFVLVHSDSEKEGPRKVLSAAIKNSAIQVQPYVFAQNYRTEQCTRAQKTLWDLEAIELARITIDLSIYSGLRDFGFFVLDKARTSPLGAGRLGVHVAQFEEWQPEWTDISRANHLGAEVVACKMRSPAAIDEDLGRTARARNPGACTELNIELIKTQLASLPRGEVLSRLEALYGSFKDWVLSPVEFEGTRQMRTWGPFKFILQEEKTGQNWLMSPFGVKRIQDESGAHQWELRLAAMETASQGPLVGFAGAHYCKMLDPVWVIEWGTLFAHL